jgi:hypothetical protein
MKEGLVSSATDIAGLPLRCRMAILFLGYAALAFLEPAQAQRVETQGAQSPAITAAGNVAVTYGLTPEQVEELSRCSRRRSRGCWSARR